MNIKYLIFLFFIKFLLIIPNTLYINEDVFVKYNFVNLDWLKEAVLNNDNIIISKINEKNGEIEDFNYSHEVEDEIDPPVKSTITINYKKQLNYKYEGEFLKIKIENTSNLQDLIKNIQDVKNKKTDSKGILIELNENINKIDGKIEVCSYKDIKDNKISDYSYIFYENNTKIKEYGFSNCFDNNFKKYENDNPTISKIDNVLYFFSYYQCNNKGIFENSNIENFIHKIFLKDNDINFKGLFKNSSIKNYLDQQFFNNKIINCDEMFLNCKYLEYFQVKKEYVFYGKSIFENCEKLEFCYDTYTHNEIINIPIKKNHFKNCKIIKFIVNSVHFIIDKDTKEEDFEDVFLNVSNFYYDHKKPIYLKIESNTKTDVDLDKIFNNHKLEEIIIENNSKKGILGTKKLLETGTLKKIKLIIKQENKEKNIEEKICVLDLTDKELMKYLKEEKHLYDIINIFTESPKIINDEIEKFNIKREEEKRKKEELNNDIDKKNLNMNKSTANCLCCCSKSKCC